MAFERPPKFLKLNPEGMKLYRPRDSKVSTWHKVGSSGNETWLTLQVKYGIPAARIIEFNFPAAAPNGKVVPEIVNWYLHFHYGFNCPETADGKNRRFKGGEQIAIPFAGSETEERFEVEQKNVWLGVGEAHSGDLVVAGYFNWNAKVYRITSRFAEDVEWATLSSHGFKLGVMTR